MTNENSHTMREAATLKRPIALFAIGAAGAALIAGCNPSPPSVGQANADKAPAGMPAMPATQQPGQPTEHMAQGTLNSLANGKVTITHGPIASAKWPGMTMSFRLANPDAAADLRPGQRVEFHFVIDSGMDATVTQIKGVE